MKNKKKQTEMNMIMMMMKKKKKQTEMNMMMMMIKQKQIEMKMIKIENKAEAE